MLVRVCQFAVVLLSVGRVVLPPITAAQSPPDTTIVLPEVTVTAARSTVSLREAPVRVSVLDAGAITRSGARDVGQLLALRSGAFVKSYGTGLATLSLRGASASQTLVLLDGLRIADPQLGQLDLSLLPTILLSSVEVMYGPGAALYGTDGMGGVVNMRTLRPEGPAFARLMAGGGAFGDRSTAVMAGGQRGTLSGMTALQYDVAENDFPYLDTAHFPPQKEHRRNADRRHLSVFATGAHTAGAHETRLGAWYDRAERGLPGLATIPTVGERQWDDHLRLWGQHRRHLAAGRLTIKALAQRAALRYRNPQLALDETGRTTIASFEASLQHLVATRWLVDGGVAGGYGAADHPSLERSARQWSGAAFTSATGSAGRITFFPALRLDAFASRGAGVRAAISPRLGVNVKPLPSVPLHAKASAGRAFRMPTFNDRYWQPGGNPDLRPERGWTVDAGTYWQHGAARIEATLFGAWTRDQIVWLPAPAGYYAPENRTRTRTIGFELSATVAGRVGRQAFEAGAFYTYTDARDRSDPQRRSYDRPLRYRPRDQAKLYLTVPFGPLALDVNGRYVGRRYVTTDGTQWLDPYAVVDAQVRAHTSTDHFSVQAALAIENAFDTQYQVIEHYPDPPRHLRLRLTIQTR